MVSTCADRKLPRSLSPMASSDNWEDTERRQACQQIPSRIFAGQHSSGFFGHTLCGSLLALSADPRSGHILPVNRHFSPNPTLCRSSHTRGSLVRFVTSLSDLSFSARVLIGNGLCADCYKPRSFPLVKRAPSSGTDSPTCV